MGASAWAVVAAAAGATVTVTTTVTNQRGTTASRTIKVEAARPLNTPEAKASRSRASETLKRPLADTPPEIVAQVMKVVRARATHCTHMHSTLDTPPRPAAGARG